MFTFEERLRKHYIIIRTLLLISFFLLIAFPGFTQEWAPIGATWYYTEKFSTWNRYDEDYIKFESVKDTVISGKNCRKITKRHKLVCNDRPRSEFMYDENGKVYFYDGQINDFQVLYDFTANQGDSWTILVKQQDVGFDTLSIVVDSADVVSINGIDLKQLYVTYNFIYELYSEVWDTMTYHSRIIEKIGDIHYMFNFVPAWALVCDANYSAGLRCYEDSIIGLYETGLAVSCNYRHKVMQEIMTIRETFDFEVGDVFQIRGMADGQPPNADRITITGKYFSPQKDTLYYIRYHNSYYFDLGSLENHFWQKTDTIFYTDPDSSLLYYNHFGLFDFSAYVSPQYCDSLVNAFSSVAMDTTTPSDHLVENYGRGLGTIKSFKYNGSGQSIDYNDILFYYKKSSGSCGTPDTTVSIWEFHSPEYEVVIFPNPFTDFLSVRVANPEMSIKNIQLFDISGRELNRIENKDHINTKNLAKGIYFVRLTFDNGQTTIKKVIKK